MPRGAVQLDSKVWIKCGCRTSHMTYGKFLDIMQNVGDGYILAAPLQCTRCLDVAIVEVEDVHNDEKAA